MTEKTAPGGHQHTVLWTDIDKLDRRLKVLEGAAHECITKTSVRWGLGLISATLLIVSGVFINTWAQSDRNAMKLEEHTEIVKRVPPLERDVKHFATALEKLERKIDSNHTAVLRAIERVSERK